MESINNYDFKMYYDKAVSEESESIRKKNQFKIKYDDVDYYLPDTQSIIKIKIIDRFNYVTHVSFILVNDRIVSFSCDGSEKNCKKDFCCHCRAAYEYIQKENLFPIYIPAAAVDVEFQSEKPIDADIDEKISAIFDMLPYHETISDDFESNDSPEIDYTQNIECADENFEEQNMPEKEQSSEVNFTPKRMSILLGRDMDTNENVYLFPNDTDCVMNNNMGIIGTMGTGKTQFTKSLITQFYHNSSDNYDGSPVGVLIFDYKGDYNETKNDFVRATHARIIKPYKMPFNPLSLNLKKHNKALLPMHTANTFKDTLSKVYNLGPKQENTLFDCMMSAYEEQKIYVDNELSWKRPTPTFDMVYRQYEKSSAFNDNDKLAVVMKKLKGFSIFAPDPLKAVSLSELLKGVVVIDISDYDEDIQSLVVAITLDQFYAQMQTFGSSKTNGKYRQIKTIILVDEADNFMKMGFVSLRKIMKEGREFGVGTILSTQSLAHFCGSDDDYSKYINTWVIHNVNDLNRKNIEAVLNQTQKGMGSEDLLRIVKKLRKHESVVKISNNNPVIMHDKPFWELYNEISGGI